MSLEKMTCEACDKIIGLITWNCDDNHTFYCNECGVKK